MNIVDHPCVPGFNNSLDGGDCIKWRTLCDDLDAAELQEVRTLNLACHGKAGTVKTTFPVF